MSEDLPDLCLNCGAELDAEKPGQERQPCPSCGETRRIKQGAARLRIGRVTVSKEGRVRYVWDPAALTLFGVVYGIVVAVLGVLVAPFGLPTTAIFAGVMLVLFILCLVLWAKPIIQAMVWLLERGEK